MKLTRKQAILALLALPAAAQAQSAINPTVVTIGLDSSSRDASVEPTIAGILLVHRGRKLFLSADAIWDALDEERQR